MSWFYHVNQDSNHHYPHEPPGMTVPPADSGSSTNHNNGRAPAVGAAAGTAAHGWSSCTSPRLSDFPSAPRGSEPQSLEILSCTASNAGTGGEPALLSYVTVQEQRCVLSWFLGWNSNQRERFLQDLLGKAVPGKVCTLLDSLSTLQVKDKPPNIFECQLRLWTQWFESWNEEERNSFLHILEERDPLFVSTFYRSVAGTAGRE